MAHFSNPKDALSIIRFLVTFKFALDTNHIREEAARWVLPHVVYETLPNALNSRM